MPPTDLPVDPFSQDYAARYMALYERISQRRGYTPANERTHYKADLRIHRPFPYASKSTKLTAIHFRLMSQLLDMLELKPESEILECGFGWGNTTLTLAMLGHSVTGLDIEESYARLVRQRAEIHKVDNIELITADYLWTETADRKFDAVIFFESFHHCWEFQRLLIALHRVLKPGGKIYFAAEPINREFEVPWGVRLDGESLYVARKWGWMELGFHSDFFAELLLRTGWFGHCVSPHFWVASPKDEPMIILATDPRLHTGIGTRRDGRIHLVAPGDSNDHVYAVFGPYINLVPGRYGIKFSFEQIAPSGEAFVDICHNSGEKIVAKKSYSADEIGDGNIVLTFDLNVPADDVEVRLNVAGGFSGTLKELAIRAF